VFLQCTVQAGRKVDALDRFFTIMAEILGRYWQILDRSGKKIILLSSLGSLCY